jgi:hypothetical protein
MGAAMATDTVVSRELKSLQDELSLAQQERLATPIAFLLYNWATLPFLISR